MAKEKDPAFLFYSKDWIEGTAELMPDEKGVFVDLLAHQHQKKGLPTDVNRLARLVGLSFEEFEKMMGMMALCWTAEGLSKPKSRKIVYHSNRCPSRVLP